MSKAPLGAVTDPKAESGAPKPWPSHLPAVAVILLPLFKKPIGWIAAMGFERYTIGISRADLMRDCLRDLHLWPGCETVEGLAVLVDARGKFTVHIVDYGLAEKRVADRALRCIQRERLRRFHLKAE